MAEIVFEHKKMSEQPSGMDDSIDDDSMSNYLGFRTQQRDTVQ